MIRASSIVVVCVLVSTESGCDFPAAENPAKLRAASEFDCAYEDVELIGRPDLSPATVDVSACGHAARYTCVRGVCAREPMDEPVE